MNIEHMDKFIAYMEQVREQHPFDFNLAVLCLVRSTS